jgi:hypothetical protein
MMNLDPFVYGRTGSVDYRWLTGPGRGLDEPFFASVLERCSPLLRGSHRLYYMKSSEEGQLVCVFFTDRECLDERGRIIGFCLGLTAPRRLGRDFNYHLPEILDRLNPYVDSCLPGIRKAVANDSDVELLNPMTFGLIGSGFIEHGVGQAGETYQRGGSIQKNSDNPSNQWPAIEANKLRSSLNTPEVLSNFEHDSFASPFHDSARGEPDKGFFSQNQLPGNETPGRITAPSNPTPLEELKRLKGENDNATVKNFETPRGTSRRESVRPAATPSGSTFHAQGNGAKNSSMISENSRNNPEIKRRGFWKFLFSGEKVKK